jgi:hypothetical protein
MLFVFARMDALAHLVAVVGAAAVRGSAVLLAVGEDLGVPGPVRVLLR